MSNFVFIIVFSALVFGLLAGGLLAVWLVPRKMRDTFQLVAAQALRHNSQSFLTLANSSFRRVLPQARRLKEMGVSSDKELAGSYWIERTTRSSSRVEG